MNKDILFILSMDTEEEWDWNGPFPEQQCQVSNIDALPQFHRHCQQLGIRPTYFTDYAVAENEASAATLNAILEKQDSELGAHLHPWCNPPFFGHTGERESHVVNLPSEQVVAKLDHLLQTLRTRREERSTRWWCRRGEKQRMVVCIVRLVFPFLIYV